MSHKERLVIGQKTRRARPDRYDECPGCGGKKTKVCALCQECRFKREDIPQPEDKSIRHIPIGHGRFAIVDAADFEWLSKMKWHAGQYGKGSIFLGSRPTAEQAYRELYVPAAIKYFREFARL